MSSSSSSDDESHHGGAKLYPQPRRQASTAAPASQAPPPAPSKESTNRKRQASQVNDPESPTPLPSRQRTAERARKSAVAVKAVPFQYQVPVQMPTNINYPLVAKPAFVGNPSESSASSGYYHVRMPTGYSSYIAPQGEQHMVLASQTSDTTGSVDAITAGVGGLKLNQYQQEANKYIRHVQQQIFNILQNTYATEGLPSDFLENLDRALKDLTQNLGNLQGFIDRVAQEADNVKNKDNESQTYQATAGMQAVEIERLRSNREELRLALSRAEKNNEDVQQTYQNVLVTLKEQNECCQEKLTECQEQLEGKRHLFYVSHDDVEGKARILQSAGGNDYHEKAKIIQALIDSAPQDKANILEILFSNNAQAPAHNRSVSYQPQMLAIQGVSATPGMDASWAAACRPNRVTPPAPGMRRTPSSFHSGTVMQPGSTRFSQPRPGSRPSAMRPGSSHVGLNAARYKFDDDGNSSSAQDYGSPQRSGAGRQITVAQQAQAADWTQTIEMWKEEFAKIWRMVHGWAARYAAQVKHDQDQSIQETAPRLWDYMCDVLYPGQPEAGASHARFLLEDRQCRGYFVERMMLQYIVNNVLSVEAWMGFSDETDRELRELNDRLQTTEVFKTYIRQSIIDQISAIVSRMLADPAFGSFRAQRINFHQQRLKTIAGPLMDADLSRTDAAFDLHAIASTALQVSALMYQSRLNFEFTWSHTCSKFSVEFHVPKDPPHMMDPLMLQAKQYRLKLVVTPAIVFRDDRGVAPSVKRILRSEVFVMN